MNSVEVFVFQVRDKDLNFLPFQEDDVDTAA